MDSILKGNGHTENSTIPTDPLANLAYSISHLPRAISPALLCWLDVLSNPASMYHEAKSLSLLHRELKELLVEGEEEETGADGEVSDEKEKPKEVIKIEEDLKKGNESGKDIDKAKEDAKREKEYLLEREHAFLNSLNDSHHRLTKSISEKVYPTPICIIDNPETNTRATVWADMKTREVRNIFSRHIPLHCFFSPFLPFVFYLLYHSALFIAFLTPSSSSSLCLGGSGISRI